MPFLSRVPKLTPPQEFPKLTPEREGRLQSAERAVPTLPHNFEGDEPSFSLLACGLQAH